MGAGPGRPLSPRTPMSLGLAAWGLLAYLCMSPSHANLPLAATSSSHPRLFMVTFMNRIDRKIAYLQVSAEAHGLNPQVMGFGVEAWWPDGLGTKINALRNFVYRHVEDDDLVIYADAFDVIVFGGAEEVRHRFGLLEQQSGRSLLFNAEEYCFPRLGDVCDEASYPSSRFRWRYLNSGLIMGRGHALKSLLAHPVPNIIKGSDQMWYQERFRAGDSGILLDTSCSLFCAVTKTNWELTPDKRLRVLDTDTQPSIVHFVSVAHWPIWRNGQATSALHQVFREVFPDECSRLLDYWTLEMVEGPTHQTVFYQGPGWWRLMRSYICIQCRVTPYASRQAECEYFPSLLDWQCLPVLSVLLVAILALLLSIWHCHCCLPARYFMVLLSRPMLRQVAPGRCLTMVCSSAMVEMELMRSPTRSIKKV